MKRIIFYFLVLFFSTKAYSQRHFTLVDTTHHNTLTYMNDISGHRVPVDVKNLILDRNKILKVTTGKDTSIRSKFLHTGIANLINRQKASPGDRNAEDYYVRQLSQVSTNISKKYGRHTKNPIDKKKFTTSLSNDSSQTVFVSKNSFDTSRSSDLSAKNRFTEVLVSNDSSNYREYRYCYTQKDKKQIFFKEMRPDFLKDPVGLPLANFSVEYLNLDTLSIYVYNDGQHALQTSLLQIGVVGFKNNGGDKNSPDYLANKRAYQYAQNNKLGVWHTYDSDDPKTWIPLPADKNPIRFKNPWIPNHHRSLSDILNEFVYYFNNLTGKAKFIFSVASLFGLGTIGTGVKLTYNFLMEKIVAVKPDVK